MLLPSARPSILFITSTAFLLILTTYFLYTPSFPLSSTFSASTIITQTNNPKTYLPFTFGYAALLQTLHAYDHAGWKDIVVIDNSWDHHAFSERSHLLDEFDSLVDVVKTPVKLRFTQLQGFIDGYARERGEDMYLWGHTDVIMLRNQTDPYTGMQDCLKLAREASPLLEVSESEFDPTNPVGIVFFSYDLLTAVFTRPSGLAPWDPAMPQYGSDCDRYHRIRMAGYTTVDCPEPIAKIFHIHSVLSHEQNLQLWESGLNLDGQVELLERINAEAELYSWRGSGGHVDSEEDSGEVEEEDDWHDGVRTADLRASAAETDGGRRYFEDKWGPFDCNLTGRVPNFDVQAVRT